MKKQLTLLLIFAVSISLAQTTIPVKDTAFIKKITGPNKQYPNITSHYDYYFSNQKAWGNNYNGKWYSNYPYTIKFSYNRHIISLYKNSMFICAFTSTGNYQWFINNNKL